MNFGPSSALNLKQFDQNRQEIRGGMSIDDFNSGLSFIERLQSVQAIANRASAARNADKLFGDNIGRHKGFGDDLQNQFKSFIEAGTQDLKDLPKDQQFAAFIKAKEEQAVKMFVEALKGQKPSGLPADYNERKEQYDAMFKEILAPKIAEMFGKDVRLARHRSDLYGNGDTQVTQPERDQMSAQVLAVLSNNSQPQGVNNTPTNQPGTAMTLSQEELIKQAVAATMQDVKDPASSPDASGVDVAKKAVAEFDKMVAELNNQRSASGKAELTKEEKAELLKQFGAALASDQTGALYTGLKEEVGKYIETREQVKAYQELLAQHKKTNESGLLQGASTGVKEAVYAAQALELQKLTGEVATKLGISVEDAKTLLENSHNPSPDVGSADAITAELLNKQQQVHASAEQALNNPATTEQKIDLYKLLEGNVFNQKFSITNADGTKREVGIRELLDIETKKKISQLTGTPEEIAKQKQELLDQQTKINTQLDQSYAAAIYQKRYQQAYDKALAASGGAEGGEAAIKAAEAAGAQAGQAAFQYLSDRDSRGSLKGFDPSKPTAGLVQDLEKMAYELRALIGQPLEVAAKPAGSQA